MDQMPMFGDQTVARDESIEQVQANSVVWRVAAERALKDLAYTHWNLTSDDVWWLLRDQHIPVPTEPRAMGPVMLQGVRKGWIRATNEVRISDQSATPNHRRPQRVYASLIRGPR